MTLSSFTRSAEQAIFSERLRNIPQTLAFRLTLWYAGIFALSLLAAFVVLYASLTSETQKSIDQELASEIAEFSSLLSSGGMEAVRRNIDLEAQSSGAENLFFRVLAPDGRMLASSDLAQWQGAGIDPPALRLASHNGTRVFATVSPPGRDHRACVIYGSIGPGAVMQIGKSLEEQEHFLAIFRTTLTVTLAVLMAAAVLIGSFLARRALQGVLSSAATIRCLVSCPTWSCHSFSAIRTCRLCGGPLGRSPMEWCWWLVAGHACWPMETSWYMPT